MPTPKDSRLAGPERARLVRVVRARTDDPICPLCGYWVDRSLQRMGAAHPLSSVIDEWVPRSKGGAVSEDNCVEAHRVCNALKSDNWPVTPDLLAACRRKVDGLLSHGGALARRW